MLNVGETIGALFETRTDQVFLIETSTGRRLTYAACGELAARAAGLLAQAGIARQERVAFVLENSAEFAVFYLGCLLCGVVAVPVNPLLHRSEVAFILGHAGIKAVVHSPATKHLVADEFPCPRICVLPEQERATAASEGAIRLEDVAPAGPDVVAARAVRPDDLFSITFTSGTSAQPKGVVHTVGSLLENARCFNESLGLTESNRWLHVMTMGYMAGFLNTLLCPFAAGASVVLCPAFGPQTPLRFWAPVLEHRADTFWLSPTMAAALVALDRDPGGPRYAREHLRAVCVGTAPLGLKIKRDFEAKYGAPLLESYGLSELLFVSSNTPQEPRRDGSVGKLLPGVAARMLDERGRPTSAEGEIHIRTPQLMAGYLDYATSSPSLLERGSWFATGDVGYLDGDGHLFITGRKKDLIIRGGVNISPRAVEEVLLDHPAVDQVAVVGLPHAFYGEEVVAALVLRAGHSLDADQPSLKAVCAAKLSAASVPSRFLAVAALPLSVNGKVQKNVLRERLSQGQSTPPQPPAECGS